MSSMGSIAVAPSDPNVIYVGQAITVPGDASTYIVQRGDTLRIIANKFGTTVDNLLRLNPNITNPNVIYVPTEAGLPLLEARPR